MRSHCALYVDVGYLLAASATRVTGTSLRCGVVVSYPDLVARLIAAAEEASGMPLLRVHWYDSGRRSGGAPDGAQEAIGMLPRVKLRLGRISPQGEQKGVDLRIGLDLAAHGRNRVVDVIYLVSGDDDLCEAVEEAQNHGVQVVLMAVPDRAGKPHAVSKHLIREADDLIVLDGSVVDDTVHVRQLQTEEVPGAPSSSEAAVGV
ncbi:MAG TPA: NYN domain-containing protein, partial [Humibacillus sp.]|nr:NYN domain-containing protein [Humibacillus sp.]